MAYQPKGVTRNLQRLGVSAPDITLFLGLLGARENVPNNFLQRLKSVPAKDWDAIGKATEAEKPPLMETVIDQAIAHVSTPVKPRKTGGRW